VAREIRNRERSSPPVETPLRVYRGNLFSWRPASFARQGSQNRIAELAEWERDTLFPKHPLHSSIALVESYGSIKLLNYESLLYVAKQYGTRGDNTLLPKGQILRLLGTRWLVLPQTRSAADGPPAPWPEGAELSRLSPDFPRAWIVHDVVAMPPLANPRSVHAVDERTAAVLFPGGRLRDSLVTAVVETSSPRREWRTVNADARPTPADRTSDTCRITQYESQYVALEAALTRPGLVILSDTWYPGWRAFVSSKGTIQEATIYRTNRVQRGLWLPAGEYVIEYYYEPWSFYLGAVVSAVGCSVLAVACGASMAIRRRHVKSNN
jgi:hypothetical protein